MADSIQFILKNYSALLLLVLVFWGFGQTFLQRTGSTSGDRWLDMAIASTTGAGIFIFVLQILAAIGKLQFAILIIIILSGLILAVIQTVALVKYRANRTFFAPVRHAKNRLYWVSLVLMAAALLPTFIAPLTPPKEWDELMYHLPHANQWAQTGRLTVNEWLRYPWFPYNFNLLYSAALILRGDILAHLVHAFAGWMVTLMVYRLGVLYSNWIIATLAALIWLSLSKHFFSNSYIEMGIALFITTACATCFFWFEDSSRRGWLVLSAFMLGLAAGSKYQALTFVPLFFALLIFCDRRPSSLVLVCIAFLLPCLYWYARNLLVTGNPFNPLGAKLFGFYDWNLQDYTWQFLDIKRVANWPKPPLWPLLLVPFLKPWKQNRFLRSASIFGLYALVVWYFTSHYDRYLVPAMPVLSLLAAWAIFESISRLGSILKMRIPWFTVVCQRHALNVLGGIAAALLIIFSVNNGYKKASQVATTEEQRTDFLRQHVVAYDLLMQLHATPDLKIYQWGLEDIIYYAPNPVWGEVFGPWRYADLNGLSIPALATRLRQQGFNTLLIRDSMLAPLLPQNEFPHYFQLLGRGNGAQAFRILSPAP